jgi:protein-tyrosine phosphatase
VIGEMSLAAPQPSRHVAHDLVFNLRDLGGYHTADGRSTRWGRLFRGDGLHRLAAADVTALGLVTVLDLRTEREISERGRVEADGVDWHHLPVLQETWDPTWATPDVTPARFLADRYLVMLAEGEEALGRALRVLADVDRLPAAFHCAAGKDRTGLLAALVLGSLGVDRASIVGDYALTAASMERVLETMRRDPERAGAVDAAPRSFFAAEPDAIDRVLDDLEHRHGSVRSYVRALGVDDDVLRALDAALLTDAP